MRLQLIAICCFVLAGCSGNLNPLQVTTVQEEMKPLVFSKPAPVIPPAGINPKVITPEISRILNDKVSNGEIPPYGYVCFSTQDRLSYEAWVQDLIRYIKQSNVIIDAAQGAYVPVDKEEE